MENDKHTPGPWFGHDHETETAQVTNTPTGHGFGLRIADVWASDLDGGANLRLIAAAPDLLDALRDVLAKTRGTSTMDEIEQAKRRARAAIAKATGEA